MCDNEGRTLRSSQFSPCPLTHTCNTELHLLQLGQGGAKLRAVANVLLRNLQTSLPRPKAAGGYVDPPAVKALPRRWIQRNALGPAECPSVPVAHGMVLTEHNLHPDPLLSMLSGNPLTRGAADVRPCRLRRLSNSFTLRVVLLLPLCHLTHSPPQP